MWTEVSRAGPHDGNGVSSCAAPCGVSVRVPAVELARRTDKHVRHPREWLEQQAVAGLLEVESKGAPDERRFAIPARAAEVMTDPTSLAHLAPLGRMFGAVGPALPQLLKVYRNGGGSAGTTSAMTRASPRPTPIVRGRGTVDVAFAFECVHDMPRPVDVLSAVRRTLEPGGSLVVMDEAVADAFAPDGDDLERIMNDGVQRASGGQCRPRPAGRTFFADAPGGKCRSRGRPARDPLAAGELALTAHPPSAFSRTPWAVERPGRPSPRGPPCRARRGRSSRRHCRPPGRRRCRCWY